MTFIPVDDNYRGRDLANAMSVDVEDYFQVSAFETTVSRRDWPNMASRVAGNISRILDLFAAENVKATFFTLGWICEHHPEVVKKIADAGHEIGSHGHEHSRVGTFDHRKFFSDVEDTRKRLEDTTGTSVTGYRAPSFSINSKTLWAHDVLAEAGYKYSSSVYPVQHDHYGLPDAPRFPFRSGSGGILEIPMSSIRAFGRNWPCSGGGYFRLLPLSFSEWAIRRINSNDQMPAIFYFHPWEIDADQPRVSGISMKTRFRHYVNLSKFESRLNRILRKFRWDRMGKIFLEST